MKKNERKLISGLSVLFVAVLGVVMQLLLSRRPSEAFAQFNYYTLQTNLIVSIVAFLNIVSDWKGWRSIANPKRWFRSLGNRYNDHLPSFPIRLLPPGGNSSDCKYSPSLCYSSSGYHTLGDI